MVFENCWVLNLHNCHILLILKYFEEMSDIKTKKIGVNCDLCYSCFTKYRQTIKWNKNPLIL